VTGIFEDEEDGEDEKEFWCLMGEGLVFVGGICCEEEDEVEKRLNLVYV